MILLTKSDRDGGTAACVINTKYMTSAIWVDEFELTALNMSNQPTIWVEETPADIYKNLKGNSDG